MLLRAAFVERDVQGQTLGRDVIVPHQLVADRAAIAAPPEQLGMLPKLRLSRSRSLNGRIEP